MSCFPTASTAATTWARPIGSKSIMGWPTAGLAWRALICRIACRQGQTPTHLLQRFKSRDTEEFKSRGAPFGWANGRIAEDRNDCDLLRSEEHTSELQS